MLILSHVYFLMMCYWNLLLFLTGKVMEARAKKEKESSYLRLWKLRGCWVGLSLLTGKGLDTESGEGMSKRPLQCF